MAATEFPRSFKDPVYAALDAKTEEKLGLPPGLLVSIRTNGERSNADQVSEAAARTPYQFIPATRKAIIDKYGIDPLLSPENASEAAGLLLKEGLDRNKGDVALAVAEYHGGVDRNAWGPRTKSYVQRVTGALPADAPAQPAQAQSTFDRVSASMQSGPSPLQTVIKAYQSGAMSPEDAKAFEAQVKAGRVVLPSGVELKAPTAAPDAVTLPDAVAAAYNSGTMAPEDRKRLDALIQSGAVAKPVGPSQIPTDGNTAPTAQPADPSLLDRALGVVEAGANLASGLTTGAVGMVGGALGGIAGSIATGDFGTPQGVANAEQAAMEGAAALTYQPRTEQGQQMAEAAGKALQQVIPVAALTPQLSAAGALASPAAAQIAPVARQAMQQVQAGAGRAAEAVMPAKAPPATPGTMGSMGAAGADMALQRRTAAQELPAPIKLTEGQATRDYAQQRFERETAKDAERGGALRDRFEAQNEAILKNFDQWVDQTGAEAPNLRAVGAAVDKALTERAKRDKTEINVKYAAARRSPEAKAPVDQNLTVTIGTGDEAMASTPLAFINEQPVGLPATALTDAARQYAVRLGVAELQDGQLVPRPGVTISQMEAWRKAINEATGYEPAQIRQATILKKLIDGQTEPVAGPLFREARRAREVYANRYENVGVIKKLLDTKRGSTDRQVAFEDVFDHSIMKGSLDDVRQVRKILQTSGEDGQQAWRELQGQTMRYIRDEAARNIATDSRGNVVVSAAGLEKAIRTLDADGKLDFIFGKRGAEQVRLLNDVAKDVLTAPPNAVNTSNTASVLLAALDMGLSGAGGMPLPIASGLRLVVNNVRDRRLRQRILVALGEAPKKPERPAPRRANDRTLH